MSKRIVYSVKIAWVDWYNNTLVVSFKDGSLCKCYDVTQFEYNQIFKQRSIDESVENIRKTHPHYVSNC